MNPATKILLRRLGIAGIILLLLLWGVESYFKSSRNSLVVQHFRNGLEYTNEYQFDKALNEYDTITKMKQASKDDKELALVMEKIVNALKNAPENTALLDQLNDLSQKSGVLTDKDIARAKLKGAASPARSLEMEKQRVLKDLADLNKIDTSKLDNKQKAALEEKRQALLDELRHILDEQQNGKGDALNEATQYDKNRLNILQQEKNNRQALLNQQKKSLKKAAPNKKTLKKKLIITNQDKLAEIGARQGAVNEQQSKVDQGKEARDKQRALAAQLAAENAAQQQAAANAQHQKDLAAQQQAAANAQHQKDLAAQQQAAANAQHQKDLAAQQQAAANAQHQKDLAAQQQAAANAQHQKDLAAQQQAVANAQHQKDLAAQQQAAANAQHQKELADMQQKNNLNRANGLKKGAQSQLAAEHYDKALSLLNQAEGLNPNDGTINALKSIVALRQKNMPEAQAQATKASSKDKGEGLIPLARGEVAFANGNIPKAQEEYQNAVKKENMALAYYRLGTLALKAGNLTLASQYYDKAYNSPDKDILEISFHVKLAYNMGQTSQRLNQESKAIKMYQEAMDLDPKYTNANIALGQLYYNKKDYHNAISALSIGYAHNRENPYLITLLGKSQHQLGHQRPAEYFFQKLVDLKPNDPDALYNLGTVQIANKEFSQAATNLKKSLSLKSNNNAKAQLGIAYIGLQQYSQAEGLFTAVLNASPNDISALKGMGESSTSQGKFDVAKEYLNKALSISPNDEDVLYKMGYLYFQMKDFTNSINFFLKAYNVNPSGNNAYSLANTYLSHNEFDNALNYYSIAQTKERNPLYVEGKANAYIKKKDFAAAKQTLESIVNESPRYQYIDRVERKLNDINKLIQTMARSKSMPAQSAA